MTDLEALLWQMAKIENPKDRGNLLPRIDAWIGRGDEEGDLVLRADCLLARRLAARDGAGLRDPEASGLWVRR